MHWLFWHDWPLAQVWPHDPQFVLLVDRLTQAPLHLVRPPVHVCDDTHWLFWHDWPLAQVWPHDPQFVLLVDRLTQAPLHLVRPPVQVCDDVH